MTCSSLPTEARTTIDIVQRRIADMVRKMRGDGANPRIVPVKKLCVPLESEKPRIRGFFDEWLTMSNDECVIAGRTSDRVNDVGENVADDRS